MSCPREAPSTRGGRASNQRPNLVVSTRNLPSPVTLHHHPSFQSGHHVATMAAGAGVLGLAAGLRRRRAGRMSIQSELLVLIQALHDARLELQWEVEQSRVLIGTDSALQERLRLVDARIVAKLVRSGRLHGRH